MSRLTSPYLWLGLFAAGMAFAVAAAVVLVGATAGVNRGIEVFGATALVSAAVAGWWRASRFSRRTHLAEKTLDGVRQSMAGTALRDPLTGLGNHRLFDANLRGAFARAQRYAQSFSVLLIEVNIPESPRDGRSNNGYERVMKYLGAVIAGNLRAADFSARLTDSMFGVILFETDYEGAMFAWERLRHAARDTWPDHRWWSISGGAATYAVETAAVETLMSDADRRLALEKRRLRTEPES